MLQDMEVWSEVRRALFVEKISKREASRRFGLSHYLINKISVQESPGTYQRASPAHPKLGQEQICKKQKQAKTASPNSETIRKITARRSSDRLTLFDRRNSGMMMLFQWLH